MITEKDIMEFRQAIVSLKNYLQSVQESGGPNPFAPPAPHSGKPARKNSESLEDIRLEIGDCRRCPLCKERKTVVFGEGNPKAALMFIGEGPGADEDAQGRPFVGRAGQLLDKMITAMKMKREDVYIANIVKCRPPGNRAPKPLETDTCTQFLERQIKAIKPKFICALGTIAAQYLLKTDKPISVMRGKFHERDGTKLMPTYHPAYLLRNPEAKKIVWEDLQMIMKEI
jgi:uracil-DNA glycosylase